MRVTKVHTIISILSFAALAICLVVRDTWVSFALIVACLLIALALLGGNISHLANIVEDNPKVKTIKFVTVFNAVCFLGVVAIIILSITGTIQLTDSSKTMIASAITSLVILVLGNLCPKLPYSRHTGLRLPWTLADESTWILAHRILGYTAIPFRFLYKGIIIKHNKTEPTYTKTSLFLCEKRRFFMARTEKGVVATI